jgi:PEP-CTERM/exosortase A-associated glycosyltransferase
MNAQAIIAERIERAVARDGLDEAERVIRKHDAKLWARMARLAEPIDRGRAVEYAWRAFELYPEIDYLNLFAQYSEAMGVLVETDARLTRGLAEFPEPPVGLERQLTRVRVWKRFLELGADIPAKRPTPAYDPIPNKVLYSLHNSLPHDNSGYATRSHGFLRGLTAAGMEMAVYTRRGYPWDSLRRKKVFPLPEIADADEIDGIVYHRIQTTDEGWGQVPFDSYLAAYAAALERVVRAERPSIIHAASNFMVGVPNVIVGRRLGIPVVYEVRGMWEVTRVSREPFWMNSDHYRAYVHMETDAARGADVVITLTNALKEELVERGVPADKIAVVPNSVDPSQFSAIPRDEELARELGLEGKRVVGYIGTLVQYEGLDDLLNAAAVALDQGIDFRLLIVGDGQEMTKLRELVTDLELDDHVILPGRVPFEDVQRYYSLIDVAIFPRKPLPVTEMVSPMKPFEAMAMEKAIVVSSVRALAEIVEDGETGVIFEKGDIDSLVEALDRTVNDPELCARLGKNARKWVVSNRTWEGAAQRTLDIYRQLQGAIATDSTQETD